MVNSDELPDKRRRNGKLFYSIAEGPISLVDFIELGRVDWPTTIKRRRYAIFFLIRQWFWQNFKVYHNLLEQENESHILNLENSCGFKLCHMSYVFQIHKVSFTLVVVASSVSMKT